MKAKKVYEFINPKTDKYELEDTIPLGPEVLKRKEIEDWMEKELPVYKYKFKNNGAVFIEGSLSLPNSKFNSFPMNDLEIERHCNLNHSEIYTLPDKLKVKGYLDISDTNITELPKDLYVYWDLYIYDTKIKEIPESIEVIQYIYINIDSKIIIPDKLRDKIRHGSNGIN